LLDGFASFTQGGPLDFDSADLILIPCAVLNINSLAANMFRSAPDSRDFVIGTPGILHDFVVVRFTGTPRLPDQGSGLVFRH